MLLVMGGVVGIGLAVAAFQFYRSWSTSQQQAASRRGVQAFNDRNYERSVDEFRQAGEYLDAKAKVDEAQKRVGEALPYFERANDAARQGLTWDAAYDYRQAIDAHPKFRDAEAKLAEPSLPIVGETRETK